jgi:hypothetical protein
MAILLNRDPLLNGVAEKALYTRAWGSSGSILSLILFTYKNFLRLHWEFLLSCILRLILA